MEKENYDFLFEDQKLSDTDIEQLVHSAEQLKILREKEPNDTHVKKILNFLKSFESCSIATIEEVLRQIKCQELKISREYIPNIMHQIGLESIVLKDKSKIKILQKIKASVSESNHERARLGMIAAEKELTGVDEETATRNIDSYFKEKLEIKEVTEELKNELIEHGVVFDQKKIIHHKTLEKYITTILEKGLPVPDGVSAYQYTETKIG